MRNVRGKVVLITGAARGIGAGVAKRLAQQGAKVALVGLEPDELKRVTADCGPGAAFWEADVTSWDAMEKTVDEVAKHFGGIDVVVANAGIAATGFTRSIDKAAFERVIEVDLLGVWRTTRVCLPYLIERRGYALLVSSAAAIMHIPGNAAYSAAKAGVEAFGNSLRAEVKHLGVDVGVAHPTWIATDMVNSADKHPVFGALRASAPGLAGKTYPLSLAVDLITEGIAKRSRAIHVPGWVGAIKLIRAILPRLVELSTKGFIAAADKAAIEDIEKRGSKAASLVGPGALADRDARK